jgi:hypothetical protein
MLGVTQAVKADFTTFGDLAANSRSLLAEAHRAYHFSRPIHSRLGVGAAVRSMHGFIYSGALIEREDARMNARAERGAVDAMILATGHDMRIKALARVVAPNGYIVPIGKEPEGPPPVGTRDFGTPDVPTLALLWEMSGFNRDMPVWTMLSSGYIVLSMLGDFLPFTYPPEEPDAYCVVP